MELLVLVLLFVLTGIPLAIASNRISKAIFSLIVLIGGIFIWIDGITVTSLVSTTTYRLLYGINTVPAGDTTFTYIIFIVMTLGSIGSMFAQLTGGVEKE